MGKRIKTVRGASLNTIITHLKTQKGWKCDRPPGRKEAETEKKNECRGRRCGREKNILICYNFVSPGI